MGLGVGRPFAAALFETEAVAVHLEDVDVVGEAVEQSSGEAFGAKDFGPFGEGQVRGQHGRAALVALAEHLEEQFGACLGKRHEAEFINDEQLVAGDLLLEAQQLPLITGLDEFMDQGGGGGEADAVSLLACGETKRQRDVGLACSAVSEQQYVLAAREELAPRQFQHHRLVERRHGEEVEAIEAFGDGELRLPDASLGGAAFAVEQFKLGHAQQIAGIVEVLGGALPRHVIVLAQHGWQAQRLQVMVEQSLRRLDGCGGIAHALAPVFEGVPNKLM